MGGKVRRRSKAPPKLPTAAELAYVRALRGQVRALSAYVLGKLEPGLRAAEKAERTDAADDLRALVAALLGDPRVSSIMAGAETIATIAVVWDRLNRHNRGEVERVLGITGPLLDVDTAPELDRWRAANVDLIRTIGPDSLGEVLDLVTEAQRTGMRVETLRERIGERFAVAESRAELIARDQVLKANADLTRIRHQRVGVRSYTWSTSKDSRVRPGHAALEGQSFAWSSPPVVDPSGRVAHPGQDYQCRCVAIPIFDDEGEP
jgi:SPP1 gp7 family putative phage head morphogenesis protein